MEGKIARVAVRGAVLLFWGRVLAYALGAIGAVLVARLLTPSEYGLVTVALVVPGVLGLFSGWGVGEAMTKYIAEYRAKGEDEKIGDVICTGAFFIVLMGTTLALVGYLTASYFTVNIFHKPDALPLAKIASILLFIGPFTGLAQAIFLGFERMEYNSLIMVCDRALQTVFMPLLIIVGLGVFGAMMGFVVAALLTGLISILILLKFMRSNRRNWSTAWKLNREVLVHMMRYGIPLAVATLILSALSQYTNFLISTFCTVEDIGNFTVAFKLSVLADIIMAPVSITLFPTFSKLNSEEEREPLKKTFEYSVKYSSLFMVPVAMGTIVLAKPLTYFIFGSGYETAWLYLALMAVGWLYVGLGVEPLTQLFIGQGETKTVTKVRLIMALFGAPLAYIFVTGYGIIGSIATGLAIAWPTYIYTIKNSKAKYGIGVPIRRTLGMYMASIVAMTPVITLNLLTHLNYVAKLTIGGVIGVSLYLLAAPKVKAINKDDIRILAETLGELPYMGGLVRKVLKLEEKLL